jgi:TolB-like protein/tetratricopeptide (TPR) repeat protein
MAPHPAAARTATRPGIWRELSRRKVMRVGLAYLIAAWAIFQVADSTFDNLGLPPSAVTLVLVLAALGLPVALALAWAFDVTPAGVVRSTAQVSGPAQRRVAVLPFQNISASAENDYFADGMTEELTSVLSRMHGLQVIARTSVMVYKARPAPVTEIGQTLGVSTVLEGSVRRDGDRLRITVQLIDTQTQTHLWSQDYDRELRDVFAIQSEIARQVAGALKVKLVGTPEERGDRLSAAPSSALARYLPGASTQMRDVPPVDLAAYDQYLLGRQYFSRRTDEALRTAIRYFQQAIEQDPGYARAYAGLADVYSVAMIGYASIPRAEAAQRAKDAVDKALQLDDSLSEAHASYAFVSMYQDWNYELARREFTRALELNPSNVQAYQWFSQCWIHLREHQRAAECMQRAAELDPLSPLIATEQAWPFLYNGEYERFGACLERALRLDPGFALAHYNLGHLYGRRGDREREVEAYQRAVELYPAPAYVAWLSRALARNGRTDEARHYAESILARAHRGEPVGIFLAVIYEGLGNREQTLYWLEQAVATREFMCPVLDSEWLDFPKVREDPRFRRLLATIGMPPRPASLPPIQVVTQPLE